MSQLPVSMRKLSFSVRVGIFFNDKKPVFRGMQFCYLNLLCSFTPSIQKMHKKLHLLFFLLWMISFGLNAQIKDRVITPNKIYSDRITDQDGHPLSGIQIRVQGKNITTVTDADGQFSIDAQNGDLIILSKNGKRINSYRLDGSIYYEVKDESYQPQEQKARSEKKYSFSKRSKNTSAKFKQNLEAAISFQRTNSIKSVDLVANALKYANSKEQVSQAYTVLGDVYMNLKQYDLAVSNYKIAVNNHRNIPSQLKLAKAYLYNKQYKKSKKLYNTILRYKNTNSIQQINANEGLGDVFLRTRQFNEALKHYQAALRLAKNNSKTTKSRLLNTKISTVLEAQGETEKAEKYLIQSQDVKSKTSPQQSAVENKRAADFYSRNKNVDKEVLLRKRIVKNLEDAELDEVITEDTKEILTKPQAKLDLGNAYLKQQNFKEAIPILEESAMEAENANDIQTQKDAIQQLSEAYASLGDDNKALSNYQKYVSLVDKLYQQKEEEINAIVNLNRELSEKQNRITSLEKDRELSESKYKLFETEDKLTLENDRRQKLIIYALLLGLILLLFSLFWMFRSNKQRKLANNLLALKSLRTQMNPHFIFNALNSVNSFIAQNDERTANRYLTDFSTLMRSVLENSEEDFISLEKETELLSLYLKLEHSRFQDKFDYEFIIDDSIELTEFQIPPMLLQPYVENAVWHGLRYKKEKGFLKVELKKKDVETIEIVISDNGIGRKKSAALKTDYQKKKKSKGMQNIKQRVAILNQMYKDKVDVFIEDLYDDATGTKVVLTLKRD